MLETAPNWCIYTLIAADLIGLVVYLYWEARSWFKAPDTRKG